MGWRHEEAPSSGRWTSDQDRSDCLGGARDAIGGLGSPAIPVADRFALFAEIARLPEVWQSCDVVLACEHTASGARKLFPTQRTRCLGGRAEILRFLLDETAPKVRSIAIVSPGVFAFLRWPDLIPQILRRCSEKVVFLEQGGGLPSIMTVRTAMHRAGFYEIVVPEAGGRVDYSSVGLTPEGAFGFIASRPGIPRSASNWRTYVASRVAMPGSELLPWHSILGTTEFGEDGVVRAGAGEFGLTVFQSDRAMHHSGQVVVRGVFHWTDPGAGHASLIACYCGPQDLNMYAALVEIESRASVIVSIWRNAGAWEKLCSSTVSVEEDERMTGGPQHMALWLRVTPSSVIVGVEDDVILKAEDSALPRRGRCGIRISDSCVGISDVSVDYLDVEQ